MSIPGPPNPPDSGQPGQPDSGQPAYPPPPGYEPSAGQSPYVPAASGQPDTGQPSYAPPSGQAAQPGSGLPAYSPGQPAQPGYPPQGYPAAPPRTSTTGAKVLTFLGIAGLVLGAVGVVVGIVFMVQPVQAATDGSGSGVVGRIGGGETVTVNLDADKSYAVWIVSDYDSVTYSGSPTVTSPDGNDIRVKTSTGDSGSTTATSGWTFTSQEAGSYEISAPSLSSGDLVVTSEDLLIKVGIGVLLLVVGIGIGIVGVGLTIGGAVWWRSRAKKARAVGTLYA